jgi:hypothetical protein
VRTVSSLPRHGDGSAAHVRAGPGDGGIDQGGRRWRRDRRRRAEQGTHAALLAPAPPQGSSAKGARRTGCGPGFRSVDLAALRGAGIVSAGSTSRQRERTGWGRSYAPILLISASSLDHDADDFTSTLALLDVIAGLVPAIHVFGSCPGGTWMAGSSAAMTATLGMRGASPLTLLPATHSGTGAFHG